MESETKEGGVQKLPPGNPHTKQMPPSLLEQAEPPSVIGMVSVVSGKGSLSLLFLQQIGIGPTFFFKEEPHLYKYIWEGCNNYLI